MWRWMAGCLIIVFGIFSWTEVRGHTSPTVDQRSRSTEAKEFLPRYFDITSFEDLKLDPFASGKLTKQGAEVVWYATSELATDTVGVFIIAKQRMKPPADLGWDFPMVIEFLFDGGTSMTYMILGKPLCDRKALDDMSCDYRRFAENIAERLQQVPGFERVCIDKVAGLDGDKPLTCPLP